MHRFFAPPENITGDRVTFHKSDLSHIRTVLRLKAGDTVYVLDGKGNRFMVKIVNMKRNEVTGNIVSRDEVRSESPLTLILGQALIKGNKFDGILRRAVELGVDTVVPLITQRSVFRETGTEAEKKTARWQKIAREAARQCARAKIPEVSGVLDSIGDFCERYADCDLKLMFWEEEESVRLDAVGGTSSPGSVACLIGPEGGFTREEVDAARNYGFQTVGLGPRILKAETAPVVVAALIQSQWGDL